MKRQATITTVTFMGYKVKVWQEKREFPGMGPDHHITVGIRNAVTGEAGNLRVTAQGIAGELDKMEHVHAYEILDGRGDGLFAETGNPVPA